MRLCIPRRRLLHRCAGFLLGCLLAVLVWNLPLSADEPKDSPPADRPAERKKANAEPGAVEVGLADGSVVRLVLRDDKITIGTEFGKLAVPVAEVIRIEFATRISDELTKKIEANIAKLGSAQ